MNCSTPGSSVTNYLWVGSNACPLSLWCNLTISSSDAPFSFCPQSFPAAESFPMIGSSHQVVKVLELQLQSFQWVFRADFLRIDWIDLLLSKGLSRVFCSKEAPQFENINSLGLSLLYGPTLTSVHDCWKNQLLLSPLAKDHVANFRNCALPKHASIGLAKTFFQVFL